MQQVEIPHAAFESYIFASTNETRKQLTYIQIAMRGDHAFARAVDGHRALEIKFEGIFPHEKEIYVSRANAQKLCKVASTKKARQGKWVVEISEKEIVDCRHVDLGITIAIPILHSLDTPYPDIAMIFPAAMSEGQSAANLWGVNLTYLLDVERWRKRIGLDDPNWVKVQTPIDPLSPLMISNWSPSADIQWKTVIMSARLP